MKKMALDLDNLVVESFQTSVAERAPGTVRGHDISDTTCNQDYCTCPTGSGISCDPSCNGTCDTCEYGCGGGTGISDCVHPLSACGVCTVGGNCITDFC